MYVLHIFKERFLSVLFGGYRDDTLAISREANENTLDMLTKDLKHTLGSMELKVTIEANHTTADFLVIMLDLGSNIYRSYNKPNEKLVYINTASSHSTIEFENQVNSVSKRIPKLPPARRILKQQSSISC